MLPSMGLHRVEHDRSDLARKSQTMVFNVPYHEIPILKGSRVCNSPVLPY